MELSKFVELFAEQFDDTDASVFTAETNYSEIDEWSSLVALSVISMIDEEFEVQVTGADLRNTATVADLYNLVQTKL